MRQTTIAVPITQNTHRAVFELIFSYHSMDIKNIALKKIWEEDLGSYAVEDIRKAWDEWRMREDNSRRKPTSADLKRVLKSKRNFVNIPALSHTQHIELPREGQSWAADELRVRLIGMKKNNPTLANDIKNEPTVSGKVVLCCEAIGQPDLIAHPALQSFTNGQRVRDNASKMAVNASGR